MRNRYKIKKKTLKKSKRKGGMLKSIKNMFKKEPIEVFDPSILTEGKCYKSATYTKKELVTDYNGEKIKDGPKMVYPRYMKYYTTKTPKYLGKFIGKSEPVTGTIDGLEKQRDIIYEFDNGKISHNDMTKFIEVDCKN